MKRSLKIVSVLIIVLGMCLVLNNCSEEKEPPLVSMYELITHPEKYDGKRIKVIGNASIEFEINTISISGNRPSDYASVIFKNREDNNPWEYPYWEDLGYETREEFETVHSRYVLLEGIYMCNDRKDGLYSWNGKFVDLTEFKLWEGTK